MDKSEKILQNLQDIFNKRQGEENRWYGFHYLGENIYKGKLIADAEGNLFAEGYFYRLPIPDEEGDGVRWRYIRSFKGDPIGPVIESLFQKGYIKEGDVWRYRPQIVVKIMWVLTSAQKTQFGEQSLEMGKPYLLVFRGKRSYNQMLDALKAMISDASKTDIEILFDPHRESNRMSISYSKGQTGSFNLSLDIQRYTPPENLPPEIDEFNLHELWLDTRRDWEPDLDEYRQLAETLEEGLVRTSRPKSNPLRDLKVVRAPKEEDLPPWESPEEPPIPAPGSKMEHKGFIYEIGASGKPVCFGNYSPSDPKCLNCLFVADCISHG